MSEHVGCAKHNSAGRNGGNSRNGCRTKTVLTEIGPVLIEVPRDRDGSFEPAIAPKRTPDRLSVLQPSYMNRPTRTHPEVAVTSRATRGRRHPPQRVPPRLGQGSGPSRVS